MKTGAFARKYDLTPNGIRYYIAQGLLSPQRLGQHYDFDDRCTAQMEEIRRLKEMHYTLDEISRIAHINGLVRHSREHRLTACACSRPTGSPRPASSAPSCSHTSARRPA